MKTSLKIFFACLIFTTAWGTDPYYNDATDQFQIVEVDGKHYVLAMNAVYRKLERLPQAVEQTEPEKQSSAVYGQWHKIIRDNFIKLCKDRFKGEVRETETEHSYAFQCLDVPNYTFKKSTYSLAEVGYDSFKGHCSNLGGTPSSDFTYPIGGGYTNWFSIEQNSQGWEMVERCKYDVGSDIEAELNTLAKQEFTTKCSSFGGNPSYALNEIKNEMTQQTESYEVEYTCELQSSGCLRGDDRISLQKGNGKVVAFKNRCFYSYFFHGYSPNMFKFDPTIYSAAIYRYDGYSDDTIGKIKPRNWSELMALNRIKEDKSLMHLDKVAYEAYKKKFRGYASKTLYTYASEREVITPQEKQKALVEILTERYVEYLRTKPTKYVSSYQGAIYKTGEKANIQQAKSNAAKQVLEERKNTISNKIGALQ